MPPPSLLFATPILPAAAGNGLAMRAGVFLEALARDWTVTLLVIPVAGPPSPITPFVAARSRRVVSVDPRPHLDPLWSLCERLLDPDAQARAVAAYPRPALCRYATTPAVAAVRRALGGEAFAAIHVQRSYLAAYLAPLLADGSAPGATRCSLDLDDDEALTHRRLADLHAAAGRPREAVLAAAEADKYVRYEAEWLPRFARLTTCSAAHAARLAAACPRAEVHPVPNSVALPGRVVRRFPRFGRHILFVGNLSYLPNADGIRRFILETLPLLRARHGRRLSVRIAGSAPPPDLLALAAREGVELVADPPELARHYRWADLAVIPLAAGGGTRIKLIEAFAHGVPVVSTSIGAEGIAAEDGRHLLLADAPEAFATACATLLDDRALATRLAREAHALVAERYAHGVGMAAIRAALPEA